MARVVAFDIDGSLSTQEGAELYQKLKREGATVGIVTARGPIRAQQFVDDRGMSPDFVRSAYILKGQKLSEIKDQYPADSYTYYGSWSRDRIHAKIAGWEYKEI